MKYLITGANGFIGSYLTKYLISKNNIVNALSRKFSKNTASELKDAKLISADILNSDSLHKEYFKEVETVVHLASANDQLSKNRKQGIELSAVGTANLLDKCVAYNVKNFLLFSTLQVYGSELSGSYNESSILMPENDYAINHIFAEKYSEMYSSINDINCVILRPSNVFGPFLSNDIDRWTLVPGCFCKEAVNNNSINLLSSGKQNRNFISLKQVGYAVLNISNNIKKKYDVINLVSDNYYTIREVANQVKGVFMENYNKSIHINIQSDMPAKTNMFTFSKETISSYGGNYDEPKDSLKKNIAELISSLI